MDSRVVVITGASSGIGAAVGEQLANRGDQPVLVARRADRLNEVAERCGARATVIPADLADRSEVQRVVQAVLRERGRLDVWINNVGQGISRMPSALTDDDIDDMVRVNVKTALYGMQEVLPHFKQIGRGHIINVSSMLGRIPFATFRSAYCGAKHFLNALTVTFRAEVQATHPDIQVSLVSPGVVRTEFGLSARYGGPDSRQLPDSQSAEEVAVVITEVIDSRQPDVYTRPGSAQRVAEYYATVGSDAAH
jgi:short-subunit dehydrogenase